MLVRSPAFIGECPGIVTRVYAGVSELYVDVRVFTNDTANPAHLAAVQPQSESSLKNGWRWPERGDTQGGMVSAEDVPVSPSISQQEQLARV